jgi:large subunit ribosomal protein L7/L12
MATKITPKDFVEALKDWSILDVVEAVKAIEDEFGIKAAAAVATVAAAPAAGAGAEPVEEQTEFTVTLTAVGDSKINVIKAVRELTQLGLKEAKDLVDAAPKPVLENVSKADAEKAVARLKEAGATAELKSNLRKTPVGFPKAATPRPWRGDPKGVRCSHSGISTGLDLKV